MSTGKWEVNGGVPGRDIAGSALSDESAAEDEDTEIVDSVRVRSPRGVRLPKALADCDETGIVATECADEMDVRLRDWRDPVDVCEEECRLAGVNIWVGEGVALPLLALGGDDDIWACAASELTVRGASGDGLSTP